MLKGELKNEALEIIVKERERQDGKWGIQRYNYETWLTILMEEVGEFAQAIQSHRNWSKETDADNLQEEITHVAAVSKAILEQVLEETKLRKQIELLRKQMIAQGEQFGLSNEKTVKTSQKLDKLIEIAQKME